MIFLIISHDASMTGAPVAVLRIAEFLKGQGHVVNFILRRGGVFQNRFETVGPTFVYRDNIRKSEWKDLTEILRQKPDYIISNTIVPGDILSFVASYHPGSIVVSYIHELEDVIQLCGSGGLFESVKKKTHYYWAPSQPVKKNLVENHSINPSKVSIYPGTVSEGFFRSKEKAFVKSKVATELNIPNSHKIVIGCGRLAFRKGVDVFITIAQMVFQKNTDVTFVWFGNGYDNEYCQLIESDVYKMGLSKNVVFAGDKDDMSAYFPAADLFLLSSREDPFPLVCLEAGAAGVPTIAFENSGGIGAYVGEENGVMVPYLDVVEAARAITDLLDKEQLLEKLSSNAVKYVRENFSVESIGNRMLAELREYN